MAGTGTVDVSPPSNPMYRSSPSHAQDQFLVIFLFLDFSSLLVFLLLLFLLHRFSLFFLFSFFYLLISSFHFSLSLFYFLFLLRKDLLPLVCSLITPSIALSCLYSHSFFSSSSEISPRVFLLTTQFFLLKKYIFSRVVFIEFCISIAQIIYHILSVVEYNISYLSFLTTNLQP